MKAIAATKIFDELPPMDDVLARKVTVLGSTGSIGVNTLDVIAHVRKLHGSHALPVAALTAGENVKVLIEQALAIKPELAVIGNEALFGELKQGLAGTGIEVAAGREAVIHAGARASDFFMVAIMGAAAIEPAATAAELAALSRMLAALRRRPTLSSKLVMTPLTAKPPVDSRPRARSARSADWQDPVRSCAAAG